MSSSISKPSHSDALTRLAQAMAVTASALLAGCQSTASVDPVSSHRTPNMAAGIKQKPIFLSHKPTTPLAPPQDVW
ncbi:lytic transglycosylase domain-containing protein, partial [Pseudomonas syringae group genomosp. 3]